MSDYDEAVALWNDVEGVEICEGDSPQEIAAYLKRNPRLSRVAEADGEMVGVALCGHDGRFESSSCASGRHQLSFYELRRF